MISMNLSDARQKDRERAEIAAAMARSSIKPTQAPAEKVVIGNAELWHGDCRAIVTAN